MKFRPCIDLHNGMVKQIIGETLNKSGAKENFVSSFGSAYYAKMYKGDNLRGGHIIMLGSGNEEEALSALKEYPKGMQIGGGVNLENAKYFLENGAAKIIVTSFIFKNGEINFENLEKLVKEVGKENIVLDLSCRKKEGKYFVVTNMWQEFTNFEVNLENLDLLSKYCSEFLIHGVDVEGKKQGIEKELLKILGSWINKSNLSITYAGGISSKKDIELIKKLGCEKIDFTIGSALDIFGGNQFKYEEIVRKYES